jgi:hypothetical protein
MSMTYFEWLHGNLQNDIDLDFFCQALVGAEIEQLKRTSGHNAVIADRSGQRIGEDEGDDGDDVIHHEFTLSGSSVDQMAAVGP